MNQRNIRTVRKRIELEGPARFSFRMVFAERQRGSGQLMTLLSTEINFDEHEANERGVCDISGWTCLTLRPSFANNETCREAAARLFSLSERTAFNLLDQGYRVASHRDAISRLKWLENYGTLDQYDWTREDGYSADPSEYET